MVITDDRGRTEPLGQKRSRVLALLQDAGQPLTANDVATRLSIHPNTARFHLDALQADGLVVRTAEERSAPGRPRALFAAAAESPLVAARSYQLLAEILASFLTERLPEPALDSERAGAAWGQYLVKPVPPYHRSTEPEALDALVDRLDEVGFESHIDQGDGSIQLAVTHCPFLEVADPHRDVVCALHLGMIRGLLDEIRAPLSAATLEPLVEPGLCIAKLDRQPVTR